MIENNNFLALEFSGISVRGIFPMKDQEILGEDSIPEQGTRNLGHMEWYFLWRCG